MLILSYLLRIAAVSSSVPMLRCSQKRVAIVEPEARLSSEIGFFLSLPFVVIDDKLMLAKKSTKSSAKHEEDKHKKHKTTSTAESINKKLDNRVYRRVRMRSLSRRCCCCCCRRKCSERVVSWVCVQRDRRALPNSAACQSLQSRANQQQQQLATISSGNKQVTGARMHRLLLRAASCRRELHVTFESRDFRAQTLSDWNFELKTSASLKVKTAPCQKQTQTQMQMQMQIQEHFFEVSFSDKSSKASARKY